MFIVAVDTTWTNKKLKISKFHFSFLKKLKRIDKMKISKFSEDYFLKKLN